MTLVNSVIELSDEWKGRAGSAYLVVSVQNASDIDKMIKNFRNTAETLRKVINDYSQCESEVKRTVGRLVF